MKTSLDDMVLFVSIIEHGSIRKAAQAAGKAMSTVSRKLVQLEEQLGVILISRTTRSFKPTEYGLAYYESCKRMKDCAEDAELSIELERKRQKSRVDSYRRNCEILNDMLSKH